MSTQIQRRRGTTAQHSTFTGAVGEVTVDTDKEVLVVHDGAQAGGYPQMRENGSNSALALGSAATPSLKFSGDPNTGIYSPGADQVAISTNGTGRLFVDASGSVGINKAPGVTIDTQSTGSNCTLALNRTDAATAGQIQIAAGNNANSILSTGTKDLFFSTNSLERLRITSAGLVGIGTSSPGAPLDARGFATYRGNVYTIASFCANSTNTPLNILQGIDGTHPSISAGQNSTGTWGALGFVTSEQYRMLITNAGNVGIGTTPETTLDVNGAITLRAVSIPGTGKARIYERDTDNKLYIQTGTGNAIRFINNLQNDLLNIDSSGRLLVGTSTARSNFFGAAPGIAPQLQLEGGDTAASTLSITRNNNDGDGPTLAFGKSRSTTNTVVQSGDRIGRIEFQGNDATSFVRSAVIEAFVDGTPGANDMPGRLVFSTTADGASSPTERMRMNSVGKVIVNDTAAILDATFSILAQSGNNAIALKSNASTTFAILNIWGNETSGNQIFFRFATDSNAERGSITYNRGGGVVAYNTTSDYRSKTILGEVEAPGDTIDALKVYRGIMNGATVERPMLIAHEAQEVAPYCVTGEKDAVDDDNNPIYQQMDHQVLVPLLIAEIQQLRARVAALEAA